MPRQAPSTQGAAPPPGTAPEPAPSSACAAEAPRRADPKSLPSHRPPSPRGSRPRPLPRPPGPERPTSSWAASPARRSAEPVRALHPLGPWLGAVPGSAARDVPRGTPRPRLRARKEHGPSDASGATPSRAGDARHAAPRRARWPERNPAIRWQQFQPQRFARNAPAQQPGGGTWAGCGRPSPAPRRPEREHLRAASAQRPGSGEPPRLPHRPSARPRACRIAAPPVGRPRAPACRRPCRFSRHPWVRQSTQRGPSGLSPSCFPREMPSPPWPERRRASWKAPSRPFGCLLSKRAQRMAPRAVRPVLPARDSPVEPLDGEGLGLVATLNRGSHEATSPG